MQTKISVTATLSELTGLAAETISKRFNDTNYELDIKLADDPQSTRFSMTDAPSQAVLRQIAANNLIEAIKQHRFETKIGLKESKDYIEYIKYDVLAYPRMS